MITTLMKKNKYTFNDFFFDFICLWPVFFLSALIIGNIIVNGVSIQK